MFPQYRNPWERLIAFVDLRLACTKALEIALFGGQQMKEGRSDRAVRAGSTHLQLLTREFGAHVEQMKVRPFVVPERFDQ